MITTDEIIHLMQLSGKSIRSICKEACIVPNTVYLWRDERKLPRVFTLKKVLEVIGLKLVANEINGDKQISLDMKDINQVIKDKGLKKKFVADKAGIHETSPFAWAKSNKGGTLVNMEAYLNVIGYTIDVEPLGENYE